MFLGAKPLNPPRTTAKKSHRPPCKSPPMRNTSLIFCQDFARVLIAERTPTRLNPQLQAPKPKTQLGQEDEAQESMEKWLGQALRVGAWGVGSNIEVVILSRCSPSRIAVVSLIPKSVFEKLRQPLWRLELRAFWTLSDDSRTVPNIPRRSHVEVHKP